MGLLFLRYNSIIESVRANLKQNAVTGFYNAGNGV